MKAPVILKKYGNRRLYDTRRSGYVTLVEVEEILQGGEDVQVIDAKTNEDLTKSVLVQIILEREETREVLPAAFLKQVIRLGNSPLKETFSRQLGGFLQGFLDAQRSFVQAQRELGEQMTKMAPYPFSMLANPFAAFAPPPPRPAAVSEPPPRRDDEDLRDLRDQLHETQALVRQLLKKSQEGEPVAEETTKPRSSASRRAAEEKRRRARS